MTTENRRASLWSTAISFVGAIFIIVPLVIWHGTEYFQMPIGAQICIAVGAVMLAPIAVVFLLLFTMLGVFYVPDNLILVSLCAAGAISLHWYFYFRIARRIIRSREATKAT